jgi:hypothetical protein
VGVTTIVAIQGNHANRAGSFFECNVPAEVRGRARRPRTENRGYVCLEADQLLQSVTRNTPCNRDKGTKAERRHQESRKKAVEGSMDDMAELREHAAAQVALFNIGAEETETAAESAPEGRHVGEGCVFAGLPEPNALATRFRNQLRRMRNAYRGNLP